MSARSTGLLLLLVLFAAPAGAQSLEEFNRGRDEITLTSMSVLAGWSAINLAAGTTLSIVSPDPVARSFHQMNAGWNVVNALLAVPSLISALGRLDSPPDLTLAESLQAQNSFEDILLFNAGLDLAYMAAGVWLLERANSGGSDADLFEGFGYSLILQGGFLFVFDLVVYVVQRGNFSRVRPLL